MTEVSCIFFMMTSNNSKFEQHNASHSPVMVDEIVECFATVPSGLVVDATFGLGGHAVAKITKDKLDEFLKYLEVNVVNVSNTSSSKYFKNSSNLSLVIFAPAAPL